MSNPTEKINELDRKLVELSGEVRFNENLLLRSEAVLSELVELQAECKARNDVQDERMVRILEELQHNHRDIDEVRKASDANQQHILKTLDALDQRLRAMENWRWIFLGAFSVIAFLTNTSSFSSIIS